MKAMPSEVFKPESKHKSKNVCETEFCACPAPLGHTVENLELLREPDQLNIDQTI